MPMNVRGDENAMLHLYDGGLLLMESSWIFFILIKVLISQNVETLDIINFLIENKETTIN